MLGIGAEDYYESLKKKKRTFYQCEGHLRNFPALLSL